MCICCCFCNCCNSYSSKCVEFCILVLSSITFLCSFVCSLCINYSHLTTTCFVLLVIQIFFSAFMTTSVLCIVIFRFKGSVNKNKNSISCYFAVISLALSILIFLISLVAESLIQTHFKYIDYPCKDKPIQSDQNTIVFRFLSLEVITDEQRNEFCKDKTYDYYASICTKLEYTMSYLTSSIIEIC